MPRGRPVPLIDLSQDVKTQLQSIARSRSLPHGLVRRAQIILMAAEGLSNKTIAQNIDLSAAVVGMWRKRFIQQGLMGLYDEPKPGGPRSISDEQIARLIRKTLNKKPKNMTHWTCPPSPRKQNCQNQRSIGFGMPLGFNPIDKSISNFLPTRSLSRRFVILSVCI